jgi:hypothetical protein
VSEIISEVNSYEKDDFTFGKEAASTFVIIVVVIAAIIAIADTPATNFFVLFIWIRLFHFI